MKNNTIIEKINHIICKQVWMDSDLLEYDTKLTDQGFEELDEVEIIMKIESEFGLYINDTEALKLKTPRQIHDYVINILDNEKL